VCFAASAECKVYCLDARRAAIRWTASTGAPARCGPTVRGGKVYVGADDGRVYCFHAADGTPAWQLDAAPHGDRVIGQGYMMSLWPVRTGVVLAGPNACFAAGLYANYGLSLHAVRASDGRPAWTSADFGRGDEATAQGYLLADDRRIVVPAGRTFPLVFDRSSGKLQGRITAGRNGPNGGSYAVLSGNLLVNGAGSLTAYDLDAPPGGSQGPAAFAPPLWSWIRSQAVVADAENIYMVTDTDVFAIARGEVARACGPATGFETNRRPDWSRCLWRKTAQRVPDALILAGGRLVAGGAGKVVAYDAATGDVLWSAKVEGRARGLAVANGRLLVSTTTGRIYSFAGTGAGRRIAPPAPAEPFPGDRLGEFYRRTAEAIVRTAPTGVAVHGDCPNFRRENGTVPLGPGFGLVIGGAAPGRPGQLACELARRTSLRIQLVEPDQPSAAAARTALCTAGFYGTRVQVEHGSLTALGYPPFFANLVVCEQAFFGGEIGTPPAELSRVLRPCGGTAFVGQPPGGADLGAAATAAAVADWLRGLDASCRPSVAGAWAVVCRGKLPGAADWTHQGADPANTYCSEDRLVRPPFGILWFGDPGPHEAADRHARGAAPLVVNGRLFVAGPETVAAYDAYNGTFLWRRPVPGIGREQMPLECSGLVATDDRLFVAVGSRCLRLDAATGREEHAYELPPRKDGQKRLWGWTAVADGLLLGSRTETPRKFSSWPRPTGNTSEALFAFDLTGGELRWIRESTHSVHNAIAVLGRRLFFIDGGDAPAGQGSPPSTCDVRRLVALDLPSGRELWHQDADVTHCVVHPNLGSGDYCGGELALMGKGKVLVLCGSPFHADHELEAYRRGALAERSLTAFDAESGRKLWTRPGNYQTRPIIVGRTIFAEPWFFDLAGGAAKTGPQGKPLELFRGSGCGGFAASAGTAFFRAGAICYRPFDAAGRIAPLVSGQRPSCWISFVPAGGIVVAPEGSAGCTCPYAIQGSVALYPKDLPAETPRPADK